MPPWIIPDQYLDDDLSRFDGFVYVIENLRTGRLYVGRKFMKAMVRGVLREAPWRKYWGSSKELTADIEALGHDAFRRTVLIFCETKADTVFREIEEQFKREVLSARLPDGSRGYYNKSIMGKFFMRDGPMSEEAKAKIAAASIGRQFSAATKARLSASHTGKTHSAETRAKIAAAKKNPSTETRAKMSASQKGRTHSDEAKANMRAAALRRKLREEAKL